MKQKVNINFEVILPYTVSNEVAMMVKPINAARTMPTVIVTRWFGFMANLTLGNSLRYFNP